MRQSLLGVVATLCLSVCCCGEELQPPVLDRPADGSVIFQRKLAISGSAVGSTRVAILIQGISENPVWKVADLVRPQSNGVFEAEVEFADAQYDVGYRIVAVAARGTHALRSFRPGTILRTPPAGLGHSEMVRVTLAGSARPGSIDDTLAERILLPLHGSAVGPQETVIIEGQGDPLPMVLVQPDRKGSDWYVQPEVKPVGSGRSAVQVRLGNKLALAGDRFRVCLVIPKTEKQRAALHKAGSIAEIPPALPHGKIIVVHLRPEKLPTVDFEKLLVNKSLGGGSKSVRILEPSQETMTSRRPTVKGIFDPKMVPVILVRTEVDQTTWYIQPPCEVQGEMFSNQVYLGKLGTPKGTHFQIIAVLVAPEEIDQWKSGSAITELPEKLPISKPLLLIHNGLDE